MGPVGKWGLDASRWAPFAAIAGVVALRHLTGGASSPFTPLFAFPVIWVALIGSQREVVAAVGATAAAFALPMVAMGAPHYPAGDWVRSLLWVAVAAAAAFALLHLRRMAAENEARHRTVTQVARDAFVVMDAEGRIREWSPGAEEAFGWSRDEAVGAELAELLIPPELREAHRNGLERFLETGEGPLIRRRVEVTALCRDGGERAVELTISPWRSGGDWLFSAGLHDLAERRRASEMAELARTDALTRLANRRGLDEHLTREVGRARRTGLPLSVAILDLDRFKAFNDTQGHVAGDRLLQQVARAWARELRTSDMLARHGGDEFAAVLPDCAYEDALALTERLREATPQGVGCSLGVATWDGREPAVSLLDRADAALYADKEARRGDRGAVAVGPAGP